MACLKVVMFAFLLFFPIKAFGNDPRTEARWNVGFVASLHKQMRLGKHQKSGAELLLFHIQFSTRLHDFQKSPFSKLDLVLVGTVGQSLHPKKNGIYGFEELARFYLKPKKQIEPFFEAGAGVNEFHLKIPELGSTFEFSLQAGGGIKYHLKNHQNFAYIAGYKITHYSNSGVVRPNQGINLSTVFVGITFTPKK